MKWIKLDPITRKRLERFRRIKRGYYSFIILAVAIVLSVFAPYLAESRALLVWHDGRLFLPTFEYFSMETFGQEPPPAWGIADLETEYLRLKREWALERELYDRELAEIGDAPGALAALDGRYPNRGDFVIMPPIPWDPYQNDFWYNEILNEIQAVLAVAQAADAKASSVQTTVSLANSYVEPSSVLSAASDGTITIAAHTRVYGDTSVSVDGGSITGFAQGAFVQVYYDDAAREGGAVSYQGTTSLVSQEGARHIVGGVTIPATGEPPVEGQGPRPPGYVPQELER